MALKELKSNDLAFSYDENQVVTQHIENIVRNVKENNLNKHILSETELKNMFSSPSIEKSSKFTLLKKILAMLTDFSKVPKMSLEERAKCHATHEAVVLDLKEQLPNQSLIQIYFLRQNFDPTRELVEMLCRRMKCSDELIMFEENIRDCIPALLILGHENIIYKRVFDTLCDALNEKRKLAFKRKSLDIEEKKCRDNAESFKNVYEVAKFLAFFVEYVLPIPHERLEQIQKILNQKYFIPAIPDQPREGGELQRIIKVLLDGASKFKSDLPIISLFAERLPKMIDCSEKTKVIEQMRLILSEESLLVGHPDQGSDEICEAGEEMGVKRVPIIISEKCSAAWKFIMENRRYGITLVQLCACNLQKTRNVRDLHYCSVIYNDCKWLTECLDHLTSRVNYDKSELIKIPAICALLDAQMERIWEEKTDEMKLFHEKIVAEKCNSLDEIDYQEVESDIRNCFLEFVARMEQDRSLMCRYIEAPVVDSILSKVILHVLEQLECKILLLDRIESSHIKPLLSIIQRLSKLDCFERSKLASIKLMLESSIDGFGVLWQEKKLLLSEQELRSLAQALFGEDGKAKSASLFH